METRYDDQAPAPVRLASGAGARAGVYVGILRGANVVMAIGILGVFVAGMMFAAWIGRGMR